MNTKLIEKSPLSKWKEDSKLSKLINVFHNRQEIRFVGGCLRDVLIGYKLKDIDFAISCNPSNTIKILSENKIKYQDYGLSHGSITAIIDKTKFEITSLRKDVQTYGRYAKVEYTDRWEEDALRRDFSINAIYLGMDGHIYDYMNGIQHIQNQQISFIGETEKRIKEDYLRILRFLRFLGTYKKTKYDQKDFKIVSNNFNKIKDYISNDKIRNELIKMLKNFFPINSFAKKNIKNKFVENDFIQILEKWWIKDNYQIGLQSLKECRKIINDA